MRRRTPEYSRAGSSGAAYGVGWTRVRLRQPYGAFREHNVPHPWKNNQLQDELHPCQKAPPPSGPPEDHQGPGFLFSFILGSFLEIAS